MHRFSRTFSSQKLSQTWDCALNTLAIKRGLFCNFTKTLKGSHIMWKLYGFQIFNVYYYCKSSKLSSYSLLKYLPKIPILHLNKRSFFSNFALYSKGRHFSIKTFYIPAFCNILHLEFCKFALKNGSFSITFLTKASLK